jgi:pimeloyl-ACP methyl ester carboxylesterase
MLQHFRGNLDRWDRARTDALAAERVGILVDYAGVGSSTREPSHTIASTARQMIAWADALGLVEIDLLGFSIGGFVAQEIPLVRPTLVRRLVLSGNWSEGRAGHARLARRHRRRPRREQAEEPPLRHFASHEASQAKGME